MKKFNTKLLVLTAVLAAMTTVATIIIRVPTPSTDGYFNVGDSVILATAAMLGGVPAMLAGAIGSALGDLIGGYPHWILPTAIIKGVEGLFAGLLLKYVGKRVKNFGKQAAFGVLIMAVASLIMVAGYFFASCIMSGYGYAVASVVPNLLQAGVCTAIAALLIYVVRLPKLLRLDGISRAADLSETTNNSVVKSVIDNGKEPEDTGTTIDESGKETVAEQSPVQPEAEEGTAVLLAPDDKDADEPRNSENDNG